MSLTNTEELRLKAIESKLNTFQKAIRNLASKEELKQLLLVKDTVEVVLRQIVDETVNLEVLTDTNLQLPVQNNQILRFDSTEQRWKNVSLSDSGGDGGGGSSDVTVLGDLANVTLPQSSNMDNQSILWYNSALDEWRHANVINSTDLNDGTSNNITLVPQDQGTVKVAADYKDRTEFDENALTPKGYVDAELAKFSPISPPDFPNSQTLFLVTSAGGTTPRTAIGNNPKLSSGAVTDNSAGQNPPATAGQAVLRIPSGTLIHTNTIAECGPGNKGNLNLLLNGVSAGLINFTDSDDSQILASLRISNNIDFPDIFPGFHMKFDARGDNINATQPGWSSLVMQHSEIAETLEVYFLLDDMTANPGLVNPNAVTITESAEGTLSYITGIPHYSSDSKLLISNLEMTGVTGECYFDGSPVVAHTNETSSGVNSNNKTYESIGAAGATIDGSFIPEVDIGVLALNPVEYTVNTSDAPGEIHLAVTFKNCNGSETFEFPSQKILINPSNAPGGSVNEIAGLQVSGLGSQPNNNNAFRGVTGSGDTPDIDPDSIFDHTASLVGDLETAITVGGVLKHSVEDFSNRLPAGPDLSQTPGRSGRQYATYKFQRTGQKKFDLRVVGKVSGLWIKQPQATEAYTTAEQNGWFDTTKPYAGSGIPGNGPGGNGDNNYGCAVWNVNTEPLVTGQQTDQTITCTFGTLSTTGSYNNFILLRIALESGDSITNLQINQATN